MLSTYILIYGFQFANNYLEIAFSVYRPHIDADIGSVLNAGTEAISYSFSQSEVIDNLVITLMFIAAAVINFGIYIYVNKNK